MVRTCLLLSLVICGATLARADEEIKPEPGKQIAVHLTVELENGEQGEIPFLLYVPEDYSADGPAYPMVLFLHGLGESGNGSDEELWRVAAHGPPKQVKQGRQFPFILISPQTPRPDLKNGTGAFWPSEKLIGLMAEIDDHLNIDDKRVYLTGLSMGGFGSWRLASKLPNRFAAVAPICGGGKPGEMASELTKMPIWAFHGGKDNVVPMEGSVKMVDAVNAAGGNARLTIYPEAGHDSWSATYDNPLFYDWLLGEHKE